MQTNTLHGSSSGLCWNAKHKGTLKLVHYGRIVGCDKYVVLHWETCLHDRGYSMYGCNNLSWTVMGWSACELQIWWWFWMTYLSVRDVYWFVVLWILYYHAVNWCVRLPIKRNVAEIVGPIWWCFSAPIAQWWWVNPNYVLGGVNPENLLIILCSHVCSFSFCL